jgi:general secretion pathway protein K
MAFADRTRCLNLNTLIAAGEGDAEALNEDAAKEFAALIDAVGAAGGEGVIAAVVDWIDADSLQEPGGAEDDAYAGLPTPYRTGAGPLADISEVRAMSGVDTSLYQNLGRHLCAYPGGAPVGVNVNMLDTEDAPLLTALTGGELTAAAAAEVIRDRPAAGYESVEAFWAQQAFAGIELSEGRRGQARLTSGYMEAYAVINYAEATVNLSMLFEVSGEGGPRLISRRLERFD